MHHNKKTLLRIAKKVAEAKKVTPSEIEQLLTFEKASDTTGLLHLLKKLAVPLSLLFGFFFTVFPEEFAHFVNTLPAWTNLSPHILKGIDYLWDILGEPVGQSNMLYHVPNIILYSFGILGLKKLLDVINKKSWLEKVLESQKALKDQLARGAINHSLKKGHTILFVGKGDFIGMQFAIMHEASQAVTVSEIQPNYTTIWNSYNTEIPFDDLKQVLERAGGENAGEYVFFPVKDDQIFLPSDTAYDISPHRLDILCQNIRVIEKENKWRQRRIIIIGDKFHKSFVQSEDQTSIIPRSADTISLGSIAEKYKKVTIIDPTDIVLKKIIKIAKGRKIVFRATKQGIKEYKERFYDRLKRLKYKETKKRGVLTIGYDIFEDQTEQQTLSRKVDDYYPIVLSKNVRDALLRNGYKNDEFIYVPDLIISILTQKAGEQ